MLSLICAWINGWVNNGEAGDLKRHRAHYDVTLTALSSCLFRWRRYDSGINRDPRKTRTRHTIWWIFYRHSHIRDGMRLLFDVLLYDKTQTYHLHFAHFCRCVVNYFVFWFVRRPAIVYRTQYDPIHWGLYEIMKMTLHVALLYNVLFYIGTGHGAVLYPRWRQVKTSLCIYDNVSFGWFIWEAHSFAIPGDNWRPFY